MTLQKEIEEILEPITHGLVVDKEVAALVALLSTHTQKLGEEVLAVIPTLKDVSMLPSRDEISSVRRNTTDELLTDLEKRVAAATEAYFFNDGIKACRQAILDVLKANGVKV